MCCALLTGVHVIRRPPGAQLFRYWAPKDLKVSGVYRKGVRAERELVDMLWRKGFAVVRAAGSGNMYSPDVIAIKDGKVLAFECKSWKREEVYIEEDQFRKMSEWQRRSGALLYIAWKYPRKGWLFIPFSLLRRRGSKYVISWEEGKLLGRNVL